MIYNKLAIENNLRQKGYQLICGIDEVGMANLAGGFVVCALILDLAKPYIEGIDDSKKLTWKERRRLETIIINNAIDYCMIYVPSKEINTEYAKVNGQSGSFRKLHLGAMRQVVVSLDNRPDYVISDHYMIPDLPYPQKPIQGGDTKSATIAGASILAKCHRERIMEDLAKKHCNFKHWEHSYGNYCVQEVVALHKYGPTSEHRVDFIDNIIHYRAGKIGKIDGQLVMKNCPRNKCNGNSLCSYQKYAKEYGLDIKCPIPKRR